MNATTPPVEFRNMSKSFGGMHAVRDVSLGFHPDEVVGHNRAGKSLPRDGS